MLSTSTLWVLITLASTGKSFLTPNSSNELLYHFAINDIHVHGGHLAKYHITQKRETLDMRMCILSIRFMVISSMFLSVFSLYIFVYEKAGAAPCPFE